MVAGGTKDKTKTNGYQSILLVAIIFLLLVIALELYQINTTIQERDDCGGSEENPCYVQVLPQVPAKGGAKK